eukprot:sb/3475874/
MVVTLSTAVMKVKIKQWTTVAAWHWVANDDSCGICRNLFDGCCTECTLPGDNCPIVWGECSHCFHMHCIIKWISSTSNKQQCPMCRGDWVFKESDGRTTRTGAGGGGGNDVETTPTGTGNNS